MKYRYLFLLLIQLVVITASAQVSREIRKSIRLKTGVITPTNNLQLEPADGEAFKRVKFRDRYYTLIQFDKLPNADEKKELEKQGIILFDYVPDNTYMAQIPGKLTPANLTKYKVSGVYKLEPKNKISGKLLQNLNQATPNPDQLIAVYFFGTIDKATAGDELKKVGANIVATKIQPAHVIFVRASAAVVQKIAELPFVAYVGAQSLKATPLNYNNRGSHSIDALGATSGRNLQGQGVVIGIGDDGDPSTHIDFTGRLIQRNANPPLNHGTHVTGTAAGGGILNPRNAGMAPKATIISQYIADIMINASVYQNDYNMVLTNNSYYIGDAGCPGDGEYDVISNYVDDQLNSNPTLMNVFAAGNDGSQSCAPYPPSIATIKSGFQCAKNVITVGEVDNNTFITTFFSSKGPVDDGRLKPEIVAGGNGIRSTKINNTYGLDFGTSMASPTVTGALALLYQRYRQLHSNVDPSAALIKAITVNSADDWGIAGPDFTFGFGHLNARTAVEAIENNTYFTGTINNTGSVTHTITGVPAGTEQIKVLLYWNDPAAAPFAASTLINNLDLTVTAPSGIPLIHRPLILDPSPANYANPAVEGVDNRNNIEQVVIYGPPAGNFTITINGTNIPSGPQQYYVAYQIIAPSVTVEYPFGNETWVPGESETIRWSAFGGSPNTFTVEYSTNNGGAWTVLTSTVPDTARSYVWTPIPATPTNTALVRVTRNVSGFTDQSDYNFTILGQPTVVGSNPCQGYANLTWGAVASATGYEVMMLRGDSMEPIATTAALSHLVAGLNKDSTYWFTVRALNGITPGRRAIAVSVIPSAGACTAPTFDNDIKADVLLVPTTGRMFTVSQLGVVAPQIRMRNLGSIPTAGSYNISYQVNGGTIFTDPISTIIPAASTVDQPFATTFNFAPVGTYTIKSWIDYPADVLHANDTLVTVVKQLDNTALTLSPSYTEGFEGATIKSYNSRTMGLDGVDRADFNNNNANGRARTFVNTGMARTGNRAITLDQIKNNAPATSSDSLITTFNLSGYTPMDQLWLDFYYRNHGTEFVAPGNKVWIRGSENDAWIQVFTLPVNNEEFGEYRAAAPIDIKGILATNSQAISTSFQAKFGQQGFTSANSVITDGNIDDGFSFDDIKITNALNDVGVQALVTPDLTSICALTNMETITVRVKNYSSSTVTNVSVSYDINGTIVTENIPSLTPGQVFDHSFTTTADLSAFQQHNMGIWVNSTGDNYAGNDSLLNILFKTTPLITTYPYREGFESNNGYWYTGGLNSSWEWGTPANTIINKAANGTKAWVTNLTGNYNNFETSYLYSPCFNLTGLAQPVLSFSHIFRTEDNCDCDNHWVEYSLDDITWTKLGATGSGTNWYDYAPLQVWKASDTRWHVSSINIPVNPAKVRFRIVMSSDPGLNLEGVGIDDIHVFDKAAIYSGVNITSGLTQSVSGAGWTHFSSGGNRVVSINPNGQNLGSTDVKVYINTGGVRNNSNQYYLDRNIVIQPTTAPSGPVNVRFYFLNTEANALINATGCGTCHKISDAYQAGVTQYSNAPLEENGTLADNASGTYNFITPALVDVVPYDNGYYAEYQVSNFSEFWINSGGPGANRPLPQILESFTATKVDASGLLQWVTVQESNMDKFSIEKSSNGINYSSIGEVKAYGNSSTTREYQFTDNHLLNSINYYRLKMIDKDGQYSYSPVRKLSSTDNDFMVRLFPNPVSNGKLYITASVNCSLIELRDVSGRLIRSIKTQGTQHTISLYGVAKGTYFVNIFTDGGKKVEKVFVE